MGGAIAEMCSIYCKIYFHLGSNLPPEAAAALRSAISFLRTEVLEVVQCFTKVLTASIPRGCAILKVR